MPHPLETELNAPAADIMEAIARGLRAKVDVKGKLAELYLMRQLEELRSVGAVSDYSWHDADGRPDFEIWTDHAILVVECKNVRAEQRLRSEHHATVELQKTRGGTDAQGRQTRGYRTDHFDILAACVFNATGAWEHRFALVDDLERRPDAPDTLKVMQRVSLAPDAVWWGSLDEAIRAHRARLRPTEPRA